VVKLLFMPGRDDDPSLHAKSERTPGESSEQYHHSLHSPIRQMCTSRESK
jgi:hypothetical protein